MSRKILVVGTGPLLEVGARVMSGQCLRTWHFCKPLIDAGHRVHLMTVPIPGTTDDNAATASQAARYGDFEYRRFTTNDKGRVLPEIIAATRAFAPDAMVGVNAYPAFLLANAGRELRWSKTFLPTWADLNGWTMAEGLIRGKVLGHDRDYIHFWRMEALTALSADRFSTVTTRQAYALLGEMAILGRGTADCSNVVTTVPNAVYPDYAMLTRRPGVPDFLREKLPKDSRIVLWTGGFNSWTDVPMLVTGMRDAMATEPRLAFVCTGGAVHGHDEKTYADFLALASSELHAERFLPLGWVDFNHVIALHEAAHVGLNLDGDNIETVFGARNRLTNMLGAGVPVITTRGTEIAEWIEQQELGTTIAQGQAGELVAALIDSVANAGIWQERAARAREQAVREFAAANTLRSFLGWCENPQRAAFSQEQPLARLRRLIEEHAAEPESLNAPVAPSNVGEPDSGHISRVEKLARLLKGIVRD
ncbi:MAG: hypothetical protein ABI579_00710 [Candidatus Sumerlaeota bacterium]